MTTAEKYTVIKYRSVLICAVLPIKYVCQNYMAEFMPRKS